jgi:hypothetical protein
MTAAFSHRLRKTRLGLAALLVFTTPAARSSPAPTLLDARLTQEVSGGGPRIKSFLSDRLLPFLLFNSNPLILSPPSGPTQWLFQGPPAKSKFLL